MRETSGGGPLAILPSRDPVGGRSQLFDDLEVLVRLALGERMDGRVGDLGLTGELSDATLTGGHVANALERGTDLGHGNAEYDISYIPQEGLRNTEVLNFVRVAQTRPMAGHENRRKAFRQWMAANDLSPADVARRATIPPTTLYSYLDGKSRSLRGDTEQKIASAFNVPVEILFTSGSGFTREVGVWGKIGARADVFPLSDYTTDPMYEVALPPGLDPDQEYVAFEIEGFSMPPAEPGWLVVFRRVEITPEELLNSACLVDLADGRRLFKRLRRGYSPGCYNLESWDGSPLIEDVAVTAALPFAALTPGRKAR